MVNFKQHLGRERKLDYTDPIAIHKSLDSEVSHSHLRDVQIEVLEQFRLRRSERDFVLKMSTGSGKTVVGLLLLKSYMSESHRPGVYLCSTRQLVKQVMAEAKKLGVGACEYDSPHPRASAVRGEWIIVTTYEKLFNASTYYHKFAYE